MTSHTTIHDIMHVIIIHHALGNLHYFLNCIIKFNFVLVWGPTGTKGLFLAWYYRFTPGGLRVPYGFPGIKPWLPSHEASTLSIILSLWPKTSTQYLSWMFNIDYLVPNNPWKYKKFTFTLIRWNVCEKYILTIFIDK